MSRLPLLAAMLFWGSVGLFAGLRADYSHATDAISELGVVGAPRMWAFNVLGYIVPGAVLTVFGWNVGRHVSPARWALPLCLTLSSLGLVLAGLFPGDLRQMQRLTSVMHLVGLLMGLFWLPAMAVAAVTLRTHWPGLAAWSGVLLAAFIVTFCLYAVPFTASSPGLVQRATFAIWFAWYLVAAILSRRGQPSLDRVHSRG